MAVGRALSRWLCASGADTHEARPAYLAPFWPLFVAGGACERMVGRFAFLAGLGFNMMDAALRP